jgi:hypothetical protein
MLGSRRIYVGLEEGNVERVGQSETTSTYELTLCKNPDDHHDHDHRNNVKTLNLTDVRMVNESKSLFCIHLYYICIHNIPIPIRV